ncbi:unnamed protein product [Caenorhabditis brenneri]
MLKVTLKFKDTLATYVIQNRAIIEKSPVLLVEIENLKPGDWRLGKAIEAPIPWKREAVDLTPMLLVAEFYGFKDFSDAVAGIIAEKFQNLASEVVRFELRFWIIYSMNPMS